MPCVSKRGEKTSVITIVDYGLQTTDELQQKADPPSCITV